eukprot:TRINITY_DN65593_c3_g5_i1.p3 TRINITY_DN65593_c3_g5~~TRINITY_DN65593_c3_g5_i1.p3  ORF type:complete len:101 (+),score=9.03 TRINITY_DN65593_c3_g5_i1:141-443(+)
MRPDFTGRTMLLSPLFRIRVKNAHAPQCNATEQAILVRELVVNTNTPTNRRREQQNSCLQPFTELFLPVALGRQLQHLSSIPTGSLFLQPSSSNHRQTFN